jgi:hypothetical protein
MLVRSRLPFFALRERIFIFKLHHYHELDTFVAYLLARNIRYEEDLVDQLFQLERKECAFHSKLTGWSVGGG